jgi:hypothetical protein
MADKRLSTPAGIAVYPRLKTADTKFDELGQYKADIAVPLAVAQPLMDELQADHKRHTGKAAKKSENTMWLMELDDSGEETGNVVFKIRVKNRMNKKGELWDRRPKLFDAKLKPIDVNPWGGSKMIVSFDVYEWTAGDKKGISLQPIGVQIIDLVTGSGGADASAMGFAAQDGYASPEYEGSEGMSDQSGDEDEEPGAGSTPDNGDY